MQDTEIWKPIPGYEKWYEISNKGRIKILPFVKKRIRQGVPNYVPYDLRIVDPLPQCDGYRRIELCNRDTGKVKGVKIYVLVASIFNGLDDVPLSHKDDNRANDSADNIILAIDSLDPIGLEWRPIPGFELYFQVSNTGIIRKYDGTLVTTSLTTDGYLYVSLSYKGKQKYWSVHRAVAAGFLDTWDPNLQVNHKDGNKLNNCVENLEMVTHQQNMNHYWHDPVFAEHKTQYLEYAKDEMTKRWQDTKFREKVQSVFDSPEYKERQSQTMRSIMTDPKIRQKISDNDKKFWSDLANHDLRIQQIKDSWTDEMRKETSERLQNLVWMHTPEGKSYRCPKDEVDQKLAQGYKLGRSKFKCARSKKVYCKETDTVYDSFTDCDNAMGWLPCTTYQLLHGAHTRRYKDLALNYHLSVVEEKEE